MESSSNFLSDLGGNARRSPAAGGGGVPPVLDCFFIFLFRGFSVSLEALSSNTRFNRASVVKGLYVICTCHVLE
jgi:hypothetical protein